MFIQYHIKIKDKFASPGAVSIAGVEPGLWNVVGGNQKVPQGLLGKSGANLIRGKVCTSMQIGVNLNFLTRYNSCLKQV